MYDLPETSVEIQKTFDKTSKGTATEEDFQTLKAHIEKKKRDIRIARETHGVGGSTSKPSPPEYKPLQAIMHILDGGRR